MAFTEVVYVNIPEKKFVKNDAKIINILYWRNLLIFNVFSSDSFFVFEWKITSVDFPELRESLLDLSHSDKSFDL